MKTAIYFLPVILLLNGCDIFNIRDAETPEQPRTNLPQAFERETLVDNLIISMRERSLFDYLACFSDSVLTGKRFTFVPSSGAASQYPVFSQEWDIKDEEQYFKNLTNVQDIPILLDLTDANFSPQGDSLIYQASYLLSIPFSDNNIPPNYQGDMILYIKQDNSLIWRIYFWQDIKSGNLPSWSELKGRFSN
jgi:hypothetical protein